MDGFKKWILSEMPIKNWQMQGNFSPNSKRQYGYNRVDAGILNSPKGVAKIHKKFSNSKENFDFYFVRSSTAYQHNEEGQKTPQYVQEVLGITDYQGDPSSINIVFVGNTAAEKVPMTAWTIAHRIGHAIAREKDFDTNFTKKINQDFSRLLEQLYRTKSTDSIRALKALASELGTFASARNGQLRNFNEFQYELVAQYIITGKIKFNPLPKMFVLKKKMEWGRPANDIAHADYRHSLPDWQEEIEEMAERYENYLHSIFQKLVGKTFVM